MIFGPTFGADAYDIAVSKKQFPLGIEKLLNLAPGDVAIIIDRMVNRFRQDAIFFGMGRIIIIETDQEISEVSLVLLIYPIDELLRSNAFLFSAEHDSRTMSVISTNIDTVMPLQFLQAHPDISLNYLHEVTQVNIAICVWQGTGD